MLNNNVQRFEAILSHPAVDLTGLGFAFVILDEVSDRDY